MYDFALQLCLAPQIIAFAPWRTLTTKPSQRLTKANRLWASGDMRFGAVLAPPPLPLGYDRNWASWSPSFILLRLSPTMSRISSKLPRFLLCEPARPAPGHLPSHNVSSSTSMGMRLHKFESWAKDVQTPSRRISVLQEPLDLCAYTSTSIATPILEDICPHTHERWALVGSQA